MKQTAISYDSKLGVQPTKVTRRVYERNMEHYEPPDSGEELDKDSLIDVILTHKTFNNCNPSNPNSLMTKEAYLKLLPSAKLSWNKLDPDSKALMLSSHKYKSQKPPPKPPCRDSKYKSAFSLAALCQILEVQYEDHDANDPQECETGECTQLVNFSQAKEVTSGDIRKILSVPNDKGYSSTKKEDSGEQK